MSHCLHSWIRSSEGRRKRPARSRKEFSPARWRLSADGPAYFIGAVLVNAPSAPLFPLT